VLLESAPVEVLGLRTPTATWEEPGLLSRANALEDLLDFAKANKLVVLFFEKKKEKKKKEDEPCSFLFEFCA